MRYLTFSDDKAGRQQLELLWVAVNGNQEPRSRDDQRALVKVLDKLEAITDPVPPELKCSGCGKVLATVPDDVEQRTISEGSGSRELALEDAEHRLALKCIQPDKLRLPGRSVRIAEALLTLFDDAPSEKTTPARQLMPGELAEIR